MDEVDEKIKFLDFVYLTKKEHTKLLDRWGFTGTESMIERLNNYIGQIGEKKATKKYVSHYYTILNWSRKDGQNNGQIKRQESQSVRGERRRTSTEAADRAIARIRQRSSGSPVDIHPSGNVGIRTSVMGGQVIEVPAMEIKQIS